MALCLHFGKNINLGTRGTSAKEASADLVLATLGDRELSGRVLHLRLAVRKCRGGASGQEFPFQMREATHPQLDEDGEPQSTLVVDWTAPAAAATGPTPNGEGVREASKISTPLPRPPGFSQVAGKPGWHHRGEAQCTSSPPCCASRPCGV
jgi:hypothetical protein